MEDNLYDSQQEHKSNSQSYGVYQQFAIHDGADLGGKDRKVGLCNGDKKAHHEGDRQEYPYFFRRRETLSDILSHRRHRHIGAHVEKADSDYQQQRADDEYLDFPSGKVEPGSQGKQDDYESNGKYRGQGFLELFTQRFQKVRQES